MSGGHRSSIQLHITNRDGPSRPEVPIGVIEMEHELIFDILWDIWNGVSVMEMGDLNVR